jgi:MYXO-CTERM domain-containing protein
LAIAGGTVAAPCQFPTVATYRVGDLKCSAVLIHPEAVVTAAHCVADGLPSKMKFGENFWFAATDVDVTACHSDPAFANDDVPAHDLAICHLAEPVDGLPATPLLEPCGETPVTEGLEVAIVGFGTTPSAEDFGTKRFAMARTAGPIRGDGTIWIGETGRAGCLGDSGGPALVRGTDGGWRVLGVLSFGPECGDGPMLYRTVADRADWLETAVGFSLDRCRDGDACTPIAADPLAPTDDWTRGCAGPVVTPSAAECAALPAVADDDTSTADGSGPAEDTGPKAASSQGCRVGDDAPDHRRRAWAWVLLGFALGRRRRRCRQDCSPPSVPTLWRAPLSGRAAVR